MAKVTAAKEVSVEERLQQLWKLQEIDTQVDKIQILKGELPDEVHDLEDVLEGLNTRLNNFRAEIAEYEQEIQDRKHTKSVAKELITRYEKQQENVKNNREFEALAKEIELQKLDVQLSDKKVSDYTDKIKSKGVIVDETEKQIKLQEKELKNKQKELGKIIEETEKEEQELLEQSAKAEKKVDERLLKGYKRIRSAYRNGLAVVPVMRDACGGCYTKIPPQRQVEIRQRKSIITCEHCGRILIDFTVEDTEK